MNQLNASIADIPLPRRMRQLPVDRRGYPVPWFVAKVDGEYDFRVVDTPKVARAVKYHLCWLCGQTLGRNIAFVIGPMCAVNRVSSEPPSHRECAEYAVAACPFLTKPRMRRNEKDLPPEHQKPSGIMIERNPGVSLIWVCRNYTPFRANFGDAPGTLFKIGKPEHIAFYREGRAATRAEIMESIDSGMPILRQMAHEEGPASIDELEFKYREAVRLLPAA